MEVFNKSEFNLKMKDLTFAIHGALRENPEFRKEVKKEVDRKFDGDYNTLLSTIINVEVHEFNSNFSKNGNSKVTVRNLIE